MVGKCIIDNTFSIPIIHDDALHIILSWQKRLQTVIGNISFCMVNIIRLNKFGIILYLFHLKYKNNFYGPMS